VTNSVRQRARATRCSSVAAAMARPSCVDVPRPSSSMITRLRGVAAARIALVSLSSCARAAGGGPVCDGRRRASWAGLKATGRGGGFLWRASTEMRPCCLLRKFCAGANSLGGSTTCAHCGAPRRGGTCFVTHRSARSPAPALASSRQLVTADVTGWLVGGSAPPERWSGPWRGCRRRPCACAPHRTRPCAPTLPARRSPPGAVKCGSCRPERRAGLTQYQHSADTLFTNTYPPHMKACVVDLPMQRTATRWAASATPSTALCRHALHAPSARPGRAPAP